MNTKYSFPRNNFASYTIVAPIAPKDSSERFSSLSKRIVMSASRGQEIGIMKAD